MHESKSACDDMSPEHREREWESGTERERERKSESGRGAEVLAEWVGPISTVEEGQ